MEYIEMFINFVKWVISNMGYYSAIPVGSALVIMFLLNLILQKVDKSKSVLDLKTLRKSFEFIISFPLTYGIYCVTALALKLDVNFLEQFLPGMVTLGSVVQFGYLVLNRLVISIIKFTINTISKTIKH